jgi:hypothetical protein
VKKCISPVENMPCTSKYNLLVLSERLPGVQARLGFIPIEKSENMAGKLRNLSSG